MENKPKKKVDPFFRIKHIAYCTARLPPQGNATFKDFVKYAKFQLCAMSKRLMKDPIWDTYTTEEILVEYFAHDFQESDAARFKFEQELYSKDSDVNDFASWADKNIKEQGHETEKVMGSLEERISFDPSKDVMGDS